MALLLVVSGLAAQLFSYLLLRFGLSLMAARYPLAAAAGYVMFLCVLRLWVMFRHHDLATAADTTLDVADTSLEFTDLSDASASPEAASSSSADSAWDIEELMFVVVLIGLAVSMCVAIGFVLVEAPTLFAEAVVESMLLTGLYKRMGPGADRFWVQRIVAITWKPFVVIALISGGLGWAAQHLAPAEATLGGVLRVLVGS